MKITCLIALVGAAAIGTLALAEEASDGGYVGAAACKDCHADQWSAWHKTKHASVFDKLDASQRADASCVGCHATGSAQMLAAGGARPEFPDVQCEACHGPGRQHVAAAEAKDPAGAKKSIVRDPPARACEQCHNARSPHFKGFFYKQMKSLVH